MQGVVFQGLNGRETIALDELMSGDFQVEDQVQVYDVTTSGYTIYTYRAFKSGVAGVGVYGGRFCLGRRVFGASPTGAFWGRGGFFAFLLGGKRVYLWLTCFCFWQRNRP